MEFKNVLSAALGYAVLMSACYLFAYWGPFEVNVLEQIAITDLVKLAFYPMAALTLSFLVGSSITQLFTAKALPPGGGATKADGTTREWKPWYSGAILASAALVYYFAPEPSNWTTIGALLSLAILPPLHHSSFFINLIPNNRMRWLIPFFAIYLLGQSIYMGRMNAYMVLSGNPDRRIDIARSNLPLSGSGITPVAYLGLLGDTHFLYESRTGQVVSFQDSDNIRLFYLPRKHQSKLARTAKRLLFEKRRNESDEISPSLRTQPASQITK